MLSSERLRATILASIYGLLLAIALVVSALSTQPFYHYYLGEFPLQSVMLLLGAAVTYELLIWAIFGVVFKGRRRLPAFPRYLNALIETSFPTVLIVILAESFGPTYALLTPLSLLYFLFIGLAALRLDFFLSVFTGIVAALEYLMLALYYMGEVTDLSSVEPALLLMPHHSGKALILVITGLVTGLVTLEIKRQVVGSVRSVADRNRIVGIFGQHVSPEIVDEILKQRMADMGSDLRYVCVMFLDIRDFSSFTREHEPGEVVAHLNTIFETMIEVVNRQGGVIFKFLGDGFLAVFGPPYTAGDSRQRAVAAAIEIIDTVNKQSKKKTIHPTRLGIGIHAGLAVTGNIGSILRKEYTVIGDVVNLTSRIETLNKKYHSQLLITGEVWRGVRRQHPEATPLGQVEIRGWDEPIGLYRLK